MALAPKPLTAALESHALKLGVFRRVNVQEPKNAPGQGLTCSIWLDEIRPARSGINSTSALVVYKARIQSDMLAKPLDDIDPRIATAVSAFIGAVTMDHRLGGLVRSVDIFGAEGIRLGGLMGYMNQDGREYRVFVLSIPLVVNDVWPQV